MFLDDLYRMVRDEYRDWCAFERSHGTWPICSILTAVFSIPLLFAAVMYCLYLAANTGKTAVVYGWLITIPLAGIAWYVARRLARQTDLKFAKRRGRTGSLIAD